MTGGEVHAGHREPLVFADHDHTFGQDVVRPGEPRTWWVIGLTAAMMGVEVVAGLSFGSMALLADGLHMASHASALGITAAGYAYARRHAADPRFSFGTGKVNALAGFTGALLLGVFAVVMAVESLERLLDPVTIAFDEAIWVAVVGLIVNGVSVLLLGVDHGDHRDADHDQHDHHPHRDHNLRSAYLHVLADALTSLLAIFALVSGKYLGFGWMDPAMGIVGAILVSRWSIGLLRDTAGVLLDRQAPEEVRRRIVAAMERRGERVCDLHVWSVGPGIYAAEISLVTDRPGCASQFRARVPEGLGIVHVTIEVRAVESSGRAETQSARPPKS